jgi:RNA-directed DNA polymerase
MPQYAGTVATMEDKIVQSAVVEVLNAIYEADFLGFSYGFRPGRSQHDALDALAVGITRRKVSWVLDADIRDFFTSLDHGWLRRFVEHRIGDKRVLRLIQQWLETGVIEEGVWAESDEGTPQGATVSPLLANVYLHYVFDLWVERWRRRQARGDVIVVRYADLCRLPHKSAYAACLVMPHWEFRSRSLNLLAERRGPRDAA